MKIKGKPPRRYSPPMEDVDLSGAIKMMTLEDVLFRQLEEGWCSPYDLYENSRSYNRYRLKSKCFSIRLLRYCRMGLLRRKRRNGIFVYTLSEKGEDRLLYLWKKLGCLDPPPDWENKGSSGEAGKKLAEIRLNYAINLLESKKKRIEIALRILNNSKF